MFESYQSTRLHTGPPVPPFGHIAHDWVQLPETTPLQSRSGRATDAQEEALPSPTLWKTSGGAAAELPVEAATIDTVMVKKI